MFGQQKRQLMQAPAEHLLTFSEVDIIMKSNSVDIAVTRNMVPKQYATIEGYHLHDKFREGREGDGIAIYSRHGPMQEHKFH